MNEEIPRPMKRGTMENKSGKLKCPRPTVPKSDALTEMFIVHKTYDINSLLKRQIKQIGMIG